MHCRSAILQGARLVECLHSQQLNRRQLTGTVEQGVGTLAKPQPLTFRTANSENSFWYTELRAMKTVVAGAVGANCRGANLTDCRPLGHLHWATINGHEQSRAVGLHSQPTAACNLCIIGVAYCLKKGTCLLMSGAL